MAGNGCARLSACQCGSLQVPHFQRGRAVVAHRDFDETGASLRALDAFRQVTDPLFGQHLDTQPPERRRSESLAIHAGRRDKVNRRDLSQVSEYGKVPAHADRRALHESRNPNGVGRCQIRFHHPRHGLRLGEGIVGGQWPTQISEEMLVGQDQAKILNCHRPLDRLYPSGDHVSFAP